MPLQIRSEEIQRLAKHLQLPVIECSAKLRMNIDQAFHELVRLVRRFQDLERPISDSSASQHNRNKQSKCNLL